MNDKEIDELIDKVLHEEQELPEGLSERLEQYIEQLEADEKEQKSSLFRKRFLITISSVAAALLLGVAIFFQTERTNLQPTVADTFSDPYEAAEAAEKALAFLSTQFNKGVDQVSDAQLEIEKVNEIVNKQLKDINIQ